MTTVAPFPDVGADTAFVTYCWGPHCNGATKAAARIAGLGRPALAHLRANAGRLQRDVVFGGPAAVGPATIAEVTSALALTT